MDSACILACDIEKVCGQYDENLFADHVCSSDLLQLRLRLGGGVVGSDHVATPGSVHGTLFELQLLTMPHNHIYIPPRHLLLRLKM